MPSFHIHAASTPTGVYALILAAGSAVRFGGGKLLAPLHGRPLISHVATTVAQALTAGTLSGAVAIVREHDTSLAWPLETAGATVIANPDADQGMATSLKRGLAALGEMSLDPPAGAALVMLADQPNVSNDVIARLVDSWRMNGRSVRPRYAATPATPGHPVLLDRALWSFANGLTGDRGLGSLLAGRADLTVIDVPGRNPDVNTIEDLTRLNTPGH